MRKEDMSAGRSINLALSTRGMNALKVSRLVLMSLRQFHSPSSLTNAACWLVR